MTSGGAGVDGRWVPTYVFPRVIKVSTAVLLLNAHVQTFPKPISDYQSIREKMATEMRDSRHALSRLLAKTRTSSPVTGTEDPGGNFSCGWGGHTYIVIDTCMVHSFVLY